MKEFLQEDRLSISNDANMAGNPEEDNVKIMMHKSLCQVGNADTCSPNLLL